MKKLTHEEFVQKAQKKWGQKYEYHELYAGSNKLLKVWCVRHQEYFLMNPNNLLRGYGCKKCGYEKLSLQQRKTKEQFVQEATTKHSFGTYDYDEFVYINAFTKGKIFCLKHKIIFEMRPSDHLRGQGCRECRKDNLSKLFKKPLEQFIEEANKVHHSKYDYSKFIYVNSHTKGRIYCSKHGEFKQCPNNHLNGNGCPICYSSISNGEKEWLVFLKIPEDAEHRQVRLTMENKKTFVVDGFDSATNTVYEFLRRLLAWKFK